MNNIKEDVIYKDIMLQLTTNDYPLKLTVIRYVICGCKHFNKYPYYKSLTKRQKQWIQEKLYTDVKQKYGRVQAKKACDIFSEIFYDLKKSQKQNQKQNYFNKKSRFNEKKNKKED